MSKILLLLIFIFIPVSDLDKEPPELSLTTTNFPEDVFISLKLFIGLNFLLSDEVDGMTCEGVPPVLRMDFMITGVFGLVSLHLIG